MVSVTTRMNLPSTRRESSPGLAGVAQAPGLRHPGQARAPLRGDEPATVRRESAALGTWKDFDHLDAGGAALGLFAGHYSTEYAVGALQQGGFDIGSVSVVGRDYQAREDVIGYCSTGPELAAGGMRGLFWGWIWGRLIGSAFFIIPGFGPIMVGGPLVGWMISPHETDVVTGGLSLLGGALAAVGASRDAIVRYEEELGLGKLMLIVHGSGQDTELAAQVLAQCGAEEAVGLVSRIPAP